MSRSSVYVLLALFALANHIQVQGSPLGAPLVACQDMTPQHGSNVPQTSPSPYTTTPASTQITQGSTLRLTLEPKVAGDVFKGFLVMGFDNSNVAAGPIGSFSAVSDGKAINCLQLTESAATHSNNNNKTSVTVDWVAPQGFVGTVLFKTSYVQELSTFWVQTVSPLVTVL